MSLIRKYSRLIYYCINQAIFNLGYHTSPEEQDDCFQEVIIRLLENNCKRLKNINSYEDKAFRSYLGVMTYRCTLNYFRGTKESIPLPEEMLCLIADPSSSPDQEAFRKQLIDIIASKLNPRETLVILYFLDGLTLAEVAQFMKISITTVHKLKDRAISTIEKILKGEKNKLEGEKK